MGKAKLVLDVGQCGYDHGAIATLCGKLGCEVRAAHSAAEAISAARAAAPALILVNRIFDADGYEGLKLLDTLKSDPALASVPVMLVSNYADAQAEAVRRGALPGFGKSSLHAPETTALLRAAIDS